MSTRAPAHTLKKRRGRRFFAEKEPPFAEEIVPLQPFRSEAVLSGNLAWPPAKSGTVRSRSRHTSDHNTEQMSTELQKQQAQALYLQGNDCRRRQQWADALNLYAQAAALDAESPAVAARQMLMDIMEFRCKDYYNP